jgi:hypothetical protein
LLFGDYWSFGDLKMQLHNSTIEKIVEDIGTSIVSSGHMKKINSTL